MVNLTKRSESCPVTGAINLIGNKWSLLILREALSGVRRFGEFQSNLGIAKNLLAARLRHLTECGILRAAPASDGSRYFEYVLTDKGYELRTVIAALHKWGEEQLESPSSDSVPDAQTIAERITSIEA